MIKIDDLNGGGELLGGQIPNPRSAVADDHLLPGAVPTALISFAADAPPKRLRRFDPARVGGRALLTLRPAASIERRLGEDTPQFYFPRARLCGLFSGSSHGFRL